MSRGVRARLLETLPRLAEQRAAEIDPGKGAEMLEPQAAGMETGMAQPWATLLNFARVHDLPARQSATLLNMTAKESAVPEDTQDARKHYSNFLVDMSLELRTPVNSIVGIAEMLIGDVREAGHEAYVLPLELVRRAGENLQILVDDLMDMSRIESGRMPLWPREFEIATLVEDVAETLRGLAGQNGNEIAVSGAETPGTVFADPLRVKQILMNLVSNACRFTYDGTIGIEVQRLTDAKPPVLQFRVSDNGVGVSHDQIEKLFRDFTQSKTAGASQSGGTGVGLAISRKLSRMMGGDIEMESERGIGSRFTFRLPLVPARNDWDGPVGGAEMAVNAEAVPRSKLLFIGNSAKLAALVASLDGEPMEILTAADGTAGVRIAARAMPGMILLDAALVQPSAWDVIATLKASPGVADIPVMLCAPLESVEAPGSVGSQFCLGSVYDCLPKPVNRARLLETLRRSFPTHADGGVLLVEDDPTARQSLRRYLEPDGWTVMEAENSREGLDTLRDQRPDIILLNLDMPLMDGFQFLDGLRGNDDWARIPLLVVAGRDLNGEDMARLNGGMEYLMRNGPYGADRVREFLRDTLVGADEAAVLRCTGRAPGVGPGATSQRIG